MSIPSGSRVVILSITVLLFTSIGAQATLGYNSGTSYEIETSEQTLVVDHQGGTKYTSIQPAIDDASAGDTVVIKQGTYEEQIVLSKSVRIVARPGAILDGSNIGGKTVGITIPAHSDVAPIIEGLKITGFSDGIVADETTGAWELHNITINDNSNDGLSASSSTSAWEINNSTFLRNQDEGIGAENTTGAWRLESVRIVSSGDAGLDVDGVDATGDWSMYNTSIRKSGDDGVDADGSAADWTISNSLISGNRAGIQIVNGSGDWQIKRTIIRNNTAYGVTAHRSTGNWSIERSHIRSNAIAGIEASQTSGSWLVQNTTIQGSRVGIHAGNSSGSWIVSHCEIYGTSIPKFKLSGEGTGVFAAGSSGNWIIRNSNIYDHPVTGLNATQTGSDGVAVENWWDQIESGRVCIGNVDCGERLHERAYVADPPVVSENFQSKAVNVDEYAIGVPSIVIIVGLVAVIGFLGVISWRTIQ